MIALLAAALIATPDVLEYPDPSAPYITVQAVVRFGALSGKEQALAQVIEDTLTNATESYNEDQIWQYSTMAGEPLTCSLSGDHFRVQLAVPKGQMALAAELTSELLMHARFAEDVVQADLVSAAHRPVSYWAELLQPFQLDYQRIRQEDVVGFYHKTFIPGNTTIAVGGDFDKGDGQAQMAKYLDGWAAPVQPLYHIRRIEPAPPALLARHAFPVTTVELYGHEYGKTEPDFAANLLVTTAIGVGKGSAMFRILREKMGMSYLQQAIVAPTPGGFQTHMVMVVKPSDDETSLVDIMRGALLADVANWDESTRQRALGMAEAFLKNQAIATPLYFDGASPVGFGYADELFLNAYWTEKMGHAWDASKVLNQMREVSLDDLKKMATALLTSAQGGVIHGGK